jgi:hypothetical protein
MSQVYVQCMRDEEVRDYYLHDMISGVAIWGKDKLRALNVWARPDVTFRLENYYKKVYPFKFDLRSKS